METLNSLIEGGDADLVYRIIKDSTFKNNPCLNNVYIQLGNAPTFQNYLDNFDSNFSVANLKLASSNTLADNTNAETSAPENYLITITFNENKLNRPALSIARTFMHELIHAEIYRKLLGSANQPNLNYSNYTEEQWRNYVITLRNNYPRLYDYYLRWLWNVPAGQNPSSAQHELMAQHYRTL